MRALGVGVLRSSTSKYIPHTYLTHWPQLPLALQLRHRAACNSGKVTGVRVGMFCSGDPGILGLAFVFPIPLSLGDFSGSQVHVAGYSTESNLSVRFHLLETLSSLKTLLSLSEASSVEWLHPFPGQAR